MIDKATSSTILQILKQYYPITPPLTFHNLYQLCIAVVLSAQTTDMQVNRVTPTLFARYPDFESLSKALPHEVEAIIKPLGFYRNKAKHIILLAQQVLSRYNGIVPSTREELIQLPGIGRKSANVILAMGFGIPAIPVDTHVSRVANRIGFSNTTNPLKVEQALMNLLPQDQWIIAHLLFIYHGRNRCKARNPLCSSCPIIEFCTYHSKNL